MNGNDIYIVGECFTHDDHLGTVRHFAIPVLERLVRDNPKVCPVVTFVFSPQNVEFLIGNGTVDLDRVRNMPLDVIHRPGFMCQMDGGKTQLPVDGNHRLVAHALRLRTFEMRFHNIPEFIWARCLQSEEAMRAHRQIPREALDRARR